MMTLWGASFINNFFSYFLKSKIIPNQLISSTRIKADVIDENVMQSCEWCILIHVAPWYWCILVHVAPCYWCILVHAAPCKLCILVHVAPCYWCVLVHVAPCKWFILVHVAPCKWCLLIHVAPCKWYILVHVAACKRYILVHVAPCYYLNHILKAKRKFDQLEIIIIYRQANPLQYFPLKCLATIFRKVYSKKSLNSAKSNLTYLRKRTIAQCSRN